MLACSSERGDVKIFDKRENRIVRSIKHVHPGIPNANPVFFVLIS